MINDTMVAVVMFGGLAVVWVELLYGWKRLISKILVETER